MSQKGVRKGPKKCHVLFEWPLWQDKMNGVFHEMISGGMSALVCFILYFSVDFDTLSRDVDLVRLVGFTV